MLYISTGCLLAGVLISCFLKSFCISKTINDWKVKPERNSNISLFQLSISRYNITIMLPGTVWSVCCLFTISWYGMVYLLFVYNIISMCLFMCRARWSDLLKALSHSWVKVQNKSKMFFYPWFWIKSYGSMCSKCRRVDVKMNKKLFSFIFPS